MDTVWILSLIAVNAFVLITGIMALKNVRTNKYLNEAEKKAQEGNKPKALIYLDKALKISPKNTEALSNKAVVLRDMGEEHYGEAIEYYNKALVLAQDTSLITMINYHLGVLYDNIGKYDEAKNCYQIAMTNDELQDAEFWNNYGILMYHLNDKTEALCYFEKSLAISPGFDLAKKNKQTLLTELKA